MEAASELNAASDVCHRGLLACKYINRIMISSVAALAINLSTAYWGHILGNTMFKADQFKH